MGDKEKGFHDMVKQEIDMLEREKSELQMECDILRIKLLDAKSKCQGYRMKYEELFSEREKLQQENRILRLRMAEICDANAAK